MQNTQLSLLSLLTGKLSGDAAPFGKNPNVAEGESANRDGFFSFLEKLLTAEPQTPRAGTVATVASGKSEIATTLGGQLSLNAAPQESDNLLDALAPETDVDADAAAIAGPAPALAEPLEMAPITGNSPSGKPLTGKEQHAIMTDAGQGGMAVGVIETPAAPVATPGPAIEAGAPAAAAGLQQKPVAPPAVLNAAPAAAPNAPFMEESVESVDGETEMASETLEIDTDTEPRRFFEGPSRQKIAPAGLQNNAQAQAATAIAEKGAPEALVHSAVTADRGEAVDAPAPSRLETVGTAHANQAHAQPVRDQIIAAVSGHRGDGKIEVRLDPPDLGRITIGFERDGADIVRAVITADTPDTLDLMRRNADMLHQALKDQGFENLDLSFAGRDPSAHANAEAQENAESFRLADDMDTHIIDAPASDVALGRLDRRL